MKLGQFMNVIKPKVKVEGTVNDQTDAERDLVDDIKRKFDDARNAKMPKLSLWNDCINAYNSDYFKNNNRPDYKSDEISNFIFSTIETIRPIMVDNDPKIIILPKSPEGIDSVDKIQSMFDSEWKRAKMGKKLAQAITVALQIGTAIFFMPWDAKDENGLGNVNPNIVNPYNFFPDPMATDLDNAEYVIYATYKHVNVLKQTFPDKANMIEAGTVNYKELVSSGQDTSNVKNQVLVLECYMRDYTTVQFEEENEDGTKIKKTKRKYPNGRVVTVCPDIMLLVADKPLSYKDGKFPFHLLKCYDIPFEFWGKGEIEQLLSPQTYINDLTNQIIDNAKLTANMPWIIDKNSGIGKGQLTNRPGLIVRKNPGTYVERKSPPQMPAYIQEMIETLKRDIEIISGVHDVTQGRKPGSVAAAAAIVALQESAQARIRLKVKLMELTLSEMGHMWYNRIKQYWVSTRFVRAFDEKNKMQFVDVSPEDLQADIDFLIEAGSTMPANKNAMLDLMIRLSQTPAEDGLPMIDRETVLAYTNVPDRKKILQRFDELVNGKKQEQAQAEEQAMAQQQQQMQMQQQMEQEKMMQQQALNMATNEHSANMDQIRNTNSTITDAQLNEIIKVLMEDPKMLQALTQQVSQGGEPNV